MISLAMSIVAKYHFKPSRKSHIIKCLGTENPSTAYSPNLSIT